MMNFKKKILIHLIEVQSFTNLMQKYKEQFVLNY